MLPGMAFLFITIVPENSAQKGSLENICAQPLPANVLREPL